MQSLLCARIDAVRMMSWALSPCVVQMLDGFRCMQRLASYHHNLQ